MYVIGINGSPRKHGNTATLLEHSLKGAESKGAETALVHLYDLEYTGCTSCFACKTLGGKSYGRCAVKDGLTPLLKKIEQDADAIILGSPTYFTDVSAEMKALLDRAGLVALANGGLFRGKIGAAVVAVRRGGGTHAFDTMNHMFLMSGAIVPGSTYWNLGFGLDKGEVAKDDEASRNMNDLGQTIAWLGAAIHQHAGSRPPAVVRE